MGRVISKPISTRLRETSAWPRETDARLRETSAWPRETDARLRETSAWPRETDARLRETSAWPRETDARLRARQTSARGGHPIPRQQREQPVVQPAPLAALGLTRDALEAEPQAT